MVKRNWFDGFFSNSPQTTAADIRQQTLNGNIHRGRIFARAVIAFEAILIILNGLGYLLRLSDQFNHLSYLLMYGLMLAVNLLFLYLTRHNPQEGQMSDDALRRSENALTAYIAFSLVWGSLVSLLDQKLYGQLMVFQINLIANALIFTVDRRRMRLPMILATAVLAVGLPFVQKSVNILIGHYVNLLIFVIIVWLISQVNYQVNSRNLVYNQELERTNRLLANQISENQQINDRLKQANFQLRELSLVDELTGIANRRGLRNFISQVFEQKEQPVSGLGVIMADIDRFKQYNDQYGHIAGDQILAKIAGVLAQAAGPELEIAARWGGEEFIFLSFNIQEVRLLEKAEQIRSSVESLRQIPNEDPGEPEVTISVGTSLKSVTVASDVAAVIDLADKAMYKAKQGGRNQVFSLIPDIRMVAVTTPEQAGQTAGLARRIWMEHYRPIIGEEQVEYMLNRFQTPEQIWQDIAEKGYQYDLIESGGVVAGYLAARPDSAKQECFLSKLYIVKDFRRQGLSRILLQHLIERCRRCRCRRIWLTVNKNNRGSIAAYEKLGFKRIESVVTDIGGGFVMDDDVMELVWD